MSRPLTTRDLRATERTFVSAMTALGFRRFEFLRVDHGELVLDPWPTGVRNIKFGSQYPGIVQAPPADFELKPQVAELFEYVRDVDAGEIRELEVQCGLPFSMQVELAATGLRGGWR